MKIEQPVRLLQPFRFGSDSLRQLEQKLFDSAAKPSEDAAGLAFIEAADARGEIDAVAREIQELILGGARRREIAVIARDLERYEGHITASFIEHGIPCFIDRRRTASHHPLLQSLLALLQIARFDWPTDAMLTLLKAGLATVSGREADAIENHLLAVVARGAVLWQSTDAWDPAIGLPPEEGLLPAMAIQVDEARRRVAAAVGPLVEALNGSTEFRVSDIATALFQAFDRLKIPPTLERWMAEARSNLLIEQANEHEQVWAELVSLFDQMVDLLGDTRMTLAEFIDVLDAGLETFDLALTPPTLDQVLIGQVDRSRSPELKAVFVVGLSEGEFPAVASEKLLLSDRERRELHSRNVEIEPDSRRLLLDERLLGYIALTRTSHKVYLCRATQDRATHPCEPSLFWRRASELFPDAPVRVAFRPESRPPSLIATPRQLITSLMQWARDPHTAGEDRGQTFAALYQWLATRPLLEDAIDVVRYRAWKAMSYRNDAELLPDIRQRLFPAPLQVNARQLETFAACPYQHFLKFGLRLTQRQKPELTGYHISQLYRQLLHRLLDRTLRDQKVWEQIDEESVDRSMAEIDAELSDAIGRAGGRGAHLLQRARRTLLEFRESQARTFQRSRFRPALSLTSFGRGGKCPSLQVKTGLGDSVAIYGKIDRIDLREQGGAACVIDYRLSTGALPLAEIFYGLSLRLLTSLLALQANGERVAGREIIAAGAFQMPVLRKIAPVGHPSEKKEEVHYAKPRGIFSERHLADLDTELATGRSDVVAAHIKKDGQLGSRDRSDVADQAEFEALLKHVEIQLGEIAQKILSGDISIAPYRLNDRSPCARCDYKECCRFHVSTNRYRWLQGGDRKFFFGTAPGGTMPANSIPWTPEQRAAITTVGQSLLVSAAAGSGKTAVLAERCAYLVCEAKDPCDVDDLLVVTFTEAAAAEMRAPFSVRCAIDMPAVPRSGSRRNWRSSIALRSARCTAFAPDCYGKTSMPPESIRGSGSSIPATPGSCADIARDVIRDAYDAARPVGLSAFRRVIRRDR